MLETIRELLGLQMKSVRYAIECPHCGRLHDAWMNETEILTDASMPDCPSGKPIRITLS